MNKTISTIAFAVAVFGMGITMPSCPGQQAMEQKVESLEKSTNEMKRTLQGVDGAVKGIVNDTAGMKGQLSQLMQDVQLQRSHLDQLQNTVNDLQARTASKGPGAAKPGKPAVKKRR